MKYRWKTVMVALLGATLLTTGVTPALAATTSTSSIANNFTVELSSYKAGETSSYEFIFDLTKVTQSGYKTTELQLFLPLFTIPSTLNVSDISINGEEPTAIKVSESGINITMPTKQQSVKKLLVVIRQRGGIANPNKAQNYTVNVLAFQQKTVKGSKLTAVQSLSKDVTITEWSINQPPIGWIPTPPQTPTPPKDPEPEESESFEVMIQLGSNLGVYKEASGEKETSKGLVLDTAPFVQDGSTLVPLRFVAEGIGAEVSYDDSDQTVSIKTDDKTIQMKSGYTLSIVNGEQVRLPVAPQIVNGSMMVPLRFVSETLGATVKWDNDTRVITVSKGTTTDANDSE